MAAIEIEGLRKSFGAAEVLRDIDLSVRDGEFVVLVGPSGCGKSTLLRVIAGLEPMSAGRLSIGGRVMNDVAPRDRDIAMVFQSYALYPHLDVGANMGYPLKVRGAPRGRIGAAVGAAADKLGLSALLDRRPRALSGGQRQRVAMGRAIVREPQAFLFDEPLSNLDARLREQMRIEIGKLHRDLGATSVYVTHDQIEAMTMADRIVAMEAGAIQQVGTPLELYDDPANLFVAGFIGAPAISLLPAEVGADGATLLHEGAALVTLGPGHGLAPGQAVVVGVRPEAVTLAAPGTGVAARVDYVERTGLATIVHADAGAARLRALTLNRPGVRPGEAVGLALDPARCRVFDPATGRRIRVA